MIYGLALFRSYCPEEENTEIFEAITNYFLNRLPKDFVSYWDLIFMDGSEQSRDTSATAIAVCGMSLMDAFLPETNSHKLVYKCAQHSMLRSLSENYTESKTDGITALLNEGVYSWHSGKGVNEGNIWGDYFYLEALVRFKKLENVLVKQEERKCKTQCKMVRVDERLIHGQGQLWIKSLGVNLVICANDKAAEDSLQQTLMKTVVPKETNIRFGRSNVRQKLFGKQPLVKQFL